MGTCVLRHYRSFTLVRGREIHTDLSAIAGERPGTDNHFSDFYSITDLCIQCIVIAKYLFDPVDDEGDRVNGDSRRDGPLSICRRANGHRINRF
jgi:hypothetical protein